MTVGADDDGLGDGIAAVGERQGDGITARVGFDRRCGHGPQCCVVEGGRVGQHGALAVEDRDRHPDQVGERIGDLAEPAAAQDDAREAVVDLGSALEPDRLDVEDDREHRADDLVERGRRRKLDQREVESLGGDDHRLGDGADVPRRLDRHARQAVLDEARHELLERGGVLAERVGRREQELVRLDPVEDVRDFHHVDRADDAVDARPSGDEPRLRERRELEDVRDGHPDPGAPITSDGRSGLDRRVHPVAPSSNPTGPCRRNCALALVTPPS